MKQNYFSRVDVKGRVRVCLEFLMAVGVEGKYIVDIGSSIGWLEEELLKFNPRKLIGIETDAEAVAYSQKKVKTATFIKASAGKVPLPDGVADIVVMFDVLEHVPKDDEASVVSEEFRILKRGGCLVLSTPNNTILTNILDLAWYFGHRHYTVDYLTHLLEKTGFMIDRIEIRGGLWFSVSLIWHYFMKWVVGKPFARNMFLEDKDDRQFSEKTGIHTIFIRATKAD